MRSILPKLGDALCWILPFAVLSAALAPRPALAAAASEWDQTDVTEVRLIAATDAVGTADTVRLGLQFRLDPGWEIYWRSPGDAGSPPVPNFAGSTNLAATDMKWPVPQRFFAEGDLQTVGYLDGTVFPILARLERPGEPLSLRAVVDYQACETICIPFTATLALDLPAGAATPNVFTQLIDRYAAKVPGAPEAAGLTIESVGLTGTPPEQSFELRVRADAPFSDPQLFVEGPRAFRFPAAVVRLGKDGRTALLRVPVQTHGTKDLIGETVTITLADGARAAEFSATATALAADSGAGPGVGMLISILGFAVLGGLILNLMPCVLPVLSIKLLGVISHGGGERRRVRASFLASASGILVSFLALAAGAVGLKLAGTAVGWGMQFQEPLFLVFLTLVLTLFACNLLGFYEIHMPAWVGGVAMRGAGAGAPPTLAGSFSTGVLATLLATPCSAPFLGTAIGFALSRGAGEIFAVFAALGVGMAIPYLVVAAVPAVATWLPRPGPWMLWVRRVMGLALVGTGLWLLSIIAAQVGLTGALLIATMMLAIGLVLWSVRTRTHARNRLGYATITLLALLAFVIPGLVAGPQGAAEADTVTANWRTFDRSGIAPLVADGNIVFVDITADWCLTCKVNKTMVLDTADIVERLSAPGVVAMRGDWTSPDPAIAEYLTSFGRYGVPFNAVYGPGAPDGVLLPELLTKAKVLDALAQARGLPAGAAQAQTD